MDHISSFSQPSLYQPEKDKDNILTHASVNPAIERNMGKIVNTDQPSSPPLDRSQTKRKSSRNIQFSKKNTPQKDQWTDTETDILKKIFQNPPTKKMGRRTKKVDRTSPNWVAITEIYNEKIRERNEAIERRNEHQNKPPDSGKFKERNRKSVTERYQSNILKVYDHIQPEHLPAIVEAIRKACPTKKFSAVATCGLVNGQIINNKIVAYTPPQIKNLFHYARRSLSGSYSFERTLEKILEYRGKETTERPISEELLEAPAKKIKLSSANTQNLSTVATSAPQSISIDSPLSIDIKPFDAEPFYINSPTNLFARAINSPSSSAFQFPLDPPQEEFEPESLALSDSDEQFLSLPGGSPHADHYFPTEVN